MIRIKNYLVWQKSIFKHCSIRFSKFRSQKNEKDQTQKHNLCIHWSNYVPICVSNTHFRWEHFLKIVTWFTFRTYNIHYKIMYQVSDDFFLQISWKWGLIFWHRLLFCITSTFGWDKIMISPMIIKVNQMDIFNKATICGQLTHILGYEIRDLEPPLPPPEIAAL